jgi:hypothetical protein
LAVATLVACVYLLWLVSYLKAHDPRDLIFIGRIFITKSQASDVIRPDPAYRYGDIGYDGQFAYFIALDPLRARYYMDTDAYRYTRILYPLVARALALGRPALVPYTLLAANLAAIFLGTLALAAWLRRSGVSAWYAATFGFYPGVLIVLDHDLTEVSSYALVAAAILVHDFGPRWRMLGSGLIFGLAALARETAVVFTLCYVLADLFGTEGDGGAWRSALRDRWRPAALLAVAGLGPLLVYKLLLLIWLGGTGSGLSAFFEPVPFGGLLAFASHFDTQQRVALISVVAPGMLAAAVGVFAILRGVRRPEICLTRPQQLRRLRRIRSRDDRSRPGGGALRAGLRSAPREPPRVVSGLQRALALGRSELAAGSGRHVRLPPRREADRFAAQVTRSEDEQTRTSVSYGAALAAVAGPRGHAKARAPIRPLWDSAQ